MAIHDFEKLKSQILSELNKKDKAGYFGTNADVSLLEGFINLPVQGLVGGGRSTTMPERLLPSVAVMDNKTGRLYIFSLKTLLRGKGINFD